MNQTIPQSIQAMVAERSANGEIRIAAASDLAPDGRFGESWVVLAGDRLLVLAADGAAPQVLHDLSLAHVSEAEVDQLIGGGVLRATVDGHKTNLLSYTNALAQRFGHVSMQLTAAAKGEAIPEVPEREISCPRCGLLLGEETRACPRCLRQGAVLRRLLGYARPYRAQLVVISVLMLAAGVFGLAPPYLTKILVDDVLVSRARPALLPLLVLGLAGSSILSTALAIFRARMSGWLGNKVCFDIRSELYERLQYLSLRYFDRHPTGTLVSRLTQDAGGVNDFLAFGLPWVASNAITLVGVIVAILFINWKLALLALIPAPLVILFTSAIWTRLHQVFRRVWLTWSRFHAMVNDGFSRTKVVRAFSQQMAEVDRFSLRSYDLYSASMRAELLWATFMPTLGLVMISGSFLVWYFGGEMILHRAGLTVGGLMAFLAYLGMLYGPLNGLTQSAQWMSRALTAAERLFEVLDAESDLEKMKGEVLGEHLQSGIEFRHVTFGYHRHQPVLKDVSFHLKAGQMLGLVGKSGVGKSTIFSLICRFYDADDGEILVDGIDMKKLDLLSYRSHLGAVLQEPFLFSGSIAENIAYGKPTASIEEIMAASKLANAHDFVILKPDGYDEQVGENGNRLSQGERQRVSIARAILHDPAILILDEATANVDLETEEQIQRAIAELTRGRTTLAIAHRLSTLRNADHLLVIEDGKVAEFGTHDELAAKHGVYQRLLDIHQKTSMVRGVDQ